MSYIEFENVTKEYTVGEITIKALNGASFTVEKGELTVIVGASRSWQNYNFKYSRRNGYFNKRKSYNWWQRY